MNEQQYPNVEDYFAPQTQGGGAPSPNLEADLKKMIESIAENLNATGESVSSRANARIVGRIKFG